MLFGTIQTSLTIQTLYEGKINYHNYGRDGVMSWNDCKPFFEKNSEHLLNRLTKCSYWIRLNRDYRINFYGKDFDKFIPKPKRKRLHPPLSSITSYRRIK